MGAMSGVLGMIGGVMQGIAGQQAHEAEAQAHEYNAAVALRNKQTIWEQGAAAQADQLEATTRNAATMRGILAWSGLSFTGTSTDAMYDQFKEDELTRHRIWYRTAVAMAQEQDTYNTETMGAAAQRDAGQMSLIAGILGGLQQGIGAFSRTA